MGYERIDSVLIHVLVAIPIATAMRPTETGWQFALPVVLRISLVATIIPLKNIVARH